ncbi:hypothetical protein DITRI_Ditri01bG0028600 [Diplodiscus trichospermus]
MVIVSLTLQFVLVITGNLRRGYIGKALPYVAMIVWFVYMSADWVATVALSTLLRGKVNLDHAFVVFWTPFLLWHLGSPRNITAYSLEDNDMWLRHLFGMVFRVLEAIYICIKFRSDTVKSRSDTVLNILAVPIFFTGVFKYGERIWALRSASEKQLMKSVCSYEGNASGDQLNLSEKRKIIRIGLPESTISHCFEGRDNSYQLKLLREAYSSFIIFRPLFLGLRFGLSQKFYDDMVYLKSKSAEQAFQLVGTELKYLYDLLFTKVPIYQPKRSLYLRVFCLLSAVSSLIAFSAMEKSLHPKVDIFITYLLLLGAICLDGYSFIMQALSTWTMILLPSPKNKVQKLYSMAVASRMHCIEGKMAIRSMAQHDLINYYVKANTNKIPEAVKAIDTGNVLQKYVHTNWKTVDSELKQFIYSHLEKNRGNLGEKFEPEELEKLLNGKGENILAEAGIDIKELELDKADFIQRIFVWHYATELLHYDYVDSNHCGGLGSSFKIAKTLSDYMMYLVLVRPLMLPKGFSEEINEQNKIQANKFFPDTGKKVAKKDFTRVRKTFTAAVLGYKPLGTNITASFEMIGAGSTFAQTLQDLVTKKRWDHEEKWEMISKVWMEMIIHAASHCSWKEHAQQLRHGGELLTHVALLMAHLGLSTQISRDEVSDENEFDMPPFP